MNYSNITPQGDSGDGLVTFTLRIGGWGKESVRIPSREIGFGFVSCSCRASERARRSCARVRGRDDPPNAGEHPVEISCAVAWFHLFIFAAIRMVLTKKARGMLYASFFW